jgi:predicted dehydrogenase
MATGGEVFLGWRQDGETTGKRTACSCRLVGTEGVSEVGGVNGPEVRVHNEETGGRWQDVDTGGRIHGEEHFVAAILHAVGALRTGCEPELSARTALPATELIFATYESSRRRGRVGVPLDTEDSPVLSMLESGTMCAEAWMWYEMGQEQCMALLRMGF